MKRLLILILAAITALPFTAIRAEANQPPVQNGAPVNSVEGSLTYNKETVRLKYAYAKLAEDVYKQNKLYITLLFTDRPVTEGAAERRLEEKVKSGLLKAVLIELESATRRVASYTVYADKENGSSTTYGEQLSNLTMSLTASNPNSIEGTASRSAQSGGEKEYGFDLKFKAAIKKNEWTGAFEVFPPVNVEAGRAEGKMGYDGKTAKLNYVHAKAETDIFDDRERKVILTFTEHPYSPSAPRKEQAPFLKFTLNDKTLIGLDILLEESNISYSSSGFKIDLAYLSGNTVEGRAINKDVVASKEFECEVAFKATFENDANAPVTPRTGKPMAAGGGEPGAAFLELLKAARASAQYVDAQKKDEQLEALASKSRELSKYRFEGRDSMFFMGVSLQIKNVRILRGFTDGNKATLDFVVPDPKGRVEGKVNMHLEDNQWKVGKVGLKDESGKVSF